VPQTVEDKILLRWLEDTFRGLSDWINYGQIGAQAFQNTALFKEGPQPPGTGDILEGTLIYSSTNTLPGGPFKGMNYWDGTKWVKL
jgi:hypothetical protein